MIAVDTNVLVRVITKDDIAQAKQAAALLAAADRIWIDRTVLLETGWTLKSRYRFTQEQVSRALTMVVSLRTAEIEHADRVRDALRHHATGMDLGDAFLLAFSPPGATLATFDAEFVRRANALPGVVPTRLVEDCLPPPE